MARFAFGRFVLDSDARRLSAGDTPIVLTRKVFDTLLVLVQARGQVVDRETFLKTLWPDTVVEERNLTVNISTLRRAFSAHGDEELIETFAKTGYRLIPPVVVLEARDPLPPQPPIVGAPHAVAQPVTGWPAAGRTTWWRRGLVAAIVILGVTVPAAFGVLRLTEGTPGSGAIDDPRRPEAVAVAVLPFVVTGGEDAGTFGVGVADAVIARIEAVPRVAIKRLREVAPYSNSDPIEIGKAVNADHVVEGVIQRGADRARLRVRIIDVRTGQTRWTEEFEQRDSSVYTMQDLLAANVSGALMRRINVEKAWTRYGAPPANEDAYRAYLDARMYSNRIAAGGDIRDSIKAYERSLAIEPSFAPAWSGLGRARRAYSFSAGADHDAEWKLAYEATERALALDPNWPEGHQMLGMLKYSEWQWAEAEQHMRRAVELDPQNDDAVTWLANLLRGQVRWDECIAIYQQARAINPIGTTQTQQLGEVLWHAGRHMEALGMLAEASRLNPGNSTAHRLRAEVYDTIGDHGEAIAARRIATQLNGDREYADTVLSAAPRGYRALREAELEFSRRRKDLWGVAVGLTYLGRHDEALDTLDQCITEKCGMSILIVTEPRLKALHAIPRFRDLARRVNLAHLVE